LGAWLDRNLPRRADAVIAPHAALRDYLVDCGCEAGRVHVIPPPVDTEAIVPRCEPSGDPPPVLYAGNLDAYQNLPLLREAMRLVRERLPGARLRIATASEPRDWPDAEFVPAPSFGALQEALARDCVFACPRTSWAGYPMKLLNAMAAGLAVVACAECAPCVEHERTGLVCDGTPEGMARALLRLLEDKELRRDMGGKGRQWVQARHSLAAIAERQAAAYEEALAVRPRR
jgi:glycosyltransferase involved in cell wall biosynthesis